MAHHRCSKCREEVGIRHKLHGYLFCDSCLARVLYRSPVRAWWQRAWSSLTHWVDTALGRTPEQMKARVKRDRARQYARMASARMQARGVPANPLAVMPQKR